MGTPYERNLMIVPSMDCPANCKYCFGPYDGSHEMPISILKDVIEWQNQFNKDFDIIFHGGEPLSAGITYYREALPLLKEGFLDFNVKFSMQSNLWLLTEEMCKLFKEYKVSIGTSLDGPKHINDVQRGEGYFNKTMKGIELARSYGINVGCICTFTAYSLPYLQEISDFFINKGLNFAIHAAEPSLRYCTPDNWVLSPENYEKLLKNSLDIYLENIDRIKISTIDSICKSISNGHGGICTFGECLGGYLAVDPEGNIYPCQRFVGMPEYSMGNVKNNPSHEELSQSPVWRMFQNRQEKIKDECGDCTHFDLCKGGCPYNALATGKGQFSSLKDPYCPAYKQIFQRITDRALEEVFSEDNINEIINRVDIKKGLLRHGKLLSIMSDGPHPSETARDARRVLAALTLAVTNSPDEATFKLQSLNLMYDNHQSRLAMNTFNESINAFFQDIEKLYPVKNQCSKCELRYLCGGVFRAWNQAPGELATDLDTHPVDCTHLYKRASSLLYSAMERLDVSKGEWADLGLYLP